jgi:hypothetical protein
MPEGIDKAADAFRQALGNTERVVQTRDQQGRFSEGRSAPESLFPERRTEGDESGDTRDGGEDARMRRQEERANGEPFENGETATRSRRQTSKNERQGSERVLTREEGRVNASTDPRHRREEDEPEGDDDDESGELREGDESDQDAERGDPDEDGEQSDAERDAKRDAEAGERYEVTIDGAIKEVSLKEALDGYIRTETFHQRMNKVNEATQVVSAEAQKVAQMRDNYINQTAMLEQEILTLLPKEPDWDTEYSRDPKAAHDLRKQYDAVAGKINQLRRSREAAMQERQAETSRNTETYAKNEFAKFVVDNKIPDEAALRKEISSMRRTAMSAGFSEQEVATVYDSRMLSVLRKASKYDRLMAAKPKAVIPGKGRTVTPGSAPQIGNAGRRTIDEAQGRLARSGRLDDAAGVFEKLIR